jgi:hypothetical protein
VNPWSMFGVFLFCVLRVIFVFSYNGQVSRKVVLNEIVTFYFYYSKLSIILT